MTRLAVLFMIIGFGSLVLNLFNMEFVLLSWADNYQPWVGIGLGLVGVLIIVTQGVAARRTAKQGAAKDA
jgi:hypothetical protein